MNKRNEDGIEDDDMHVVGEEDDSSDHTEADVDLPQNFKGVDQDINENLFPSAPADEDGRIL